MLSQEPAKEKLHLTLIIPGGIALGAYEGGALTALIRAVRGSRVKEAPGPELVIDVIAGASAGAMTAAMVAYTLLTGAPENLLYRAWVEDDDISKLRNIGGSRSALNSKMIQRIADRYMIDPVQWPKREPAQPESIRLVFTLTNLTPRNANIVVAPSKYGPGQTIPTVTYADWIHYRVASEANAPWNPDTWDSIKKAVVASGAFPVAFEPVAIARSGTEFVYVDGGVWNNRPLGLAIDATLNPEDLGPAERPEEGPEIDAQAERLIVVVEPSGEVAPAKANLDDFTPARVGLDALITVPRSQSFYTDLRRLTKINTQVRWLNTTLGDIDRLNLPAECQNALADALMAHSAAILQEKAGLAQSWKAQDEYDLQNQPDVKQPGSRLAKALRLFAKLVGGMRGKKELSVSTIEPAKSPEMDEGALSGALLGHIGGFLYRPLRVNDFIVGYKRAVDWLILQRFDYLASRVAEPGDEIRLSTVGWASLKDKAGLLLQLEASLIGASFWNLPFRPRLDGLSTLVTTIDVVTRDLVAKSGTFSLLWRLFVGFARLLTYVIAVIGAGFWLLLALFIFILGLLRFYQLAPSWVMKIVHALSGP